VAFSSSRSMTPPTSPMFSSCKILSELSSDRKKRTPVRWVSTVPVDLLALFLLLLTCSLKKKEQKTPLISSLFYIFGVNWISTGCVIYAVWKYFFGFSVSKNSSDIEEKIF
jgi:Kef-type K+ transport system membrane component KefB